MCLEAPGEGAKVARPAAALFGPPPDAPACVASLPGKTLEQLELKGNIHCGRRPLLASLGPFSGWAFAGHGLSAEGHREQSVERGDLEPQATGTLGGHTGEAHPAEGAVLAAPSLGRAPVPGKLFSEVQL